LVSVFAGRESILRNKILKKLEEKLKQRQVELKEKTSMACLKYRLENGLHQEELAIKIGVSRMQLYRWENMLSCPNQLAVNKLKEMGIL